jgi:hypothetical protein
MGRQIDNGNRLLGCLETTKREKVLRNIDASGRSFFVFSRLGYGLVWRSKTAQDESKNKIKHLVNQRNPRETGESR